MNGKSRALLAVGAIASVLCMAVAAPASAHAVHRKHHHHYRYSENYVRPAYRGANQNYGYGTAQLRYYQSQGRCVIDEGYGRYTFCGNL